MAGQFRWTLGSNAFAHRRLQQTGEAGRLRLRIVRASSLTISVAGGRGLPLDRLENPLFTLEMKKRLCFILVVPVFMVSCATVPRAEFNPAKPIQHIAIAKHEAIYAQHDVVLSADSLDQKLRAMNSEFDHKIGRARLYQDFELATFLAEIGALVGCISSTNSANAIGWCGGTVVMAGATLLLHQRASDLRQDVVTTYNKKYSPEVQP